MSAEPSCPRSGGSEETSGIVQQHHTANQSIRVATANVNTLHPREEKSKLSIWANDLLLGKVQVVERQLDRIDGVVAIDGVGRSHRLDRLH